MRKVVGTGLILVLLTVSPAWAISESDTVPAAPSVASVGLIRAAQPLPYISIPLFETKTPAYKHYKTRPVSELSKLIYLGDLLTQSDLTIIHDGMSYNPRTIASLVTVYVRMNYKNEPARVWIAKHAYRNGPSYGVIYVKDPQGKITLLKDLLLDELKSL